LASVAVRAKAALAAALIVVLASPAWALADPATGSATPTYGTYQSAVAAETEIADQIAAADGAIVRAQGDLAALKTQMAATQAQIQTLGGQVAALDSRLAAERAQVDAVVRFLYEDGSTSFLAVLLQATSFSDFLTRFALVVQVVQAEVRVLETVAAQRAERGREQAAAAAAGQRLAAEEAAQTTALAQLQKEQVARQQALAAAKQQAGSAADRLVALDQSLLQGLPQLETVLAGWSSLPWDSVQPQSVSVDLGAGSVVVTVTAAALSATAGLSPLALTVDPADVSLTSGAPADLQLTGPVAVKGGSLIWQPSQLTVGGAPAGPGVIAALLDGRTLVIPVPAPAPGLRLQSVKLQDGALQLDFGL
jgi:peptidoglycan hydrolase CwlO-like protein